MRYQFKIWKNTSLRLFVLIFLFIFPGFSSVEGTTIEFDTEVNFMNVRISSEPDLIELIVVSAENQASIYEIKTDSTGLRIRQEYSFKLISGVDRLQILSSGLLFTENFDTVTIYKPGEKGKLDNITLMKSMNTEYFPLNYSDEGLSVLSIKSLEKDYQFTLIGIDPQLKNRTEQNLILEGHKPVKNAPISETFFLLNDGYAPYVSWLSLSEGFEKMQVNISEINRLASLKVIKLFEAETKEGRTIRPKIFRIAQNLLLCSWDTIFRSVGREQKYVIIDTKSNSIFKESGLKIHEIIRDANPMEILFARQQSKNIICIGKVHYLVNPNTVTELSILWDAMQPEIEPVLLNKSYDKVLDLQYFSKDLFSICYFCDGQLKVDIFNQSKSEVKALASNIADIDFVKLDESREFFIIKRERAIEILNVKELYSRNAIAYQQ